MNHQQLVALTPQLTPYKRGLGNGLSILVDPKGAKYFTGRIKGQSVWVGTFGNKGSKLSLADASEKFNAIKEYCYENEITYSEYRRKKNKTKQEAWVLKDAVDHFLKECKLTIKETTFKEYTRKLNQVLSLIDEQTPLQELELVNGGKEIIEDIISKIENGGKGNNFDLGNRCRNLLKQVFDLAEDIGKMGDGQNPANRKKIRKHKVTHHPTISWEEVPTVLEKVSLHPCNSHPIAQLATKLTFMTFLRSGALTRLEWEMIDEKRKILIIDGKTSGLKRKKDCNDHIPHHVPITPHMEKLFARAKRFNQGEKYILSLIHI